jgi:hypothetical protein
MEALNKRRMESLYTRRNRLDKKMRKIDTELDALKSLKQKKWLNANGLPETIQFYRKQGDTEGVIRYVRAGESKEIVITFSNGLRLKSIQVNHKYNMSSYFESIEDQVEELHLKFVDIKFFMAIVNDYDRAQEALILDN